MCLSRGIMLKKGNVATNCKNNKISTFNPAITKK